MKVVLIHRRGPGQFVHLAPYLARMGWKVTLVCESADAVPDGVRVLPYAVAPARPTARGPARHLARAEQDVLAGHAVATLLETLRAREGVPDVVLGHIGWGGLAFVGDVLPETPVIGYCEYFHRAEGGDAGFAPGDVLTLDDRQRLRLRNVAQLVTMESMESGISATKWQRSRYPRDVQRRIEVCHEGVDVAECRPDPAARLKLPNGRELKPGDPVVTYAARDLEPCRGFPQFMEAAARIAARRDDALFVVAGGDGVSYGRLPAGGRTWREEMMARTGLDPSRIVFLGTVERDVLVRLFQVSAAHVYLTYPFVLSWSVLEAMACGALVVGSATPPVEEVLRNGANGLLANFWDTGAIASEIVAALDTPDRYRAMRMSARETIIRDFALGDCLKRQATIVAGHAGAGIRRRVAAVRAYRGEGPITAAS